MTIIAYSFWEKIQVWNKLNELDARELAWELRNRQYKVILMSDEEYSLKFEKEN